MKPITLNIITNKRIQFVDITQDINKVITETGIKEGICYLYVPHTTAAITINESADPTVQLDILNWLNKIVPFKDNYEHMEGNSDAHIKASLIGASCNIFINEGKLLLGTWQGVFFCEFDGPRKRKVYLKIISG